MFVAYGADAEALQQLGALLQEAVRDPAVLSGYISAGDSEWFSIEHVQAHPGRDPVLPPFSERSH
ncbi:hypothetical protein [Nocardia sp. NPDC059239]|uniref:hypothetical protein n=1 Tax=unclassified Nocardia TaxID=2637762 RepID=UPI00368CD14A